MDVMEGLNVRIARDPETKEDMTLHLRKVVTFNQFIINGEKMTKSPVFHKRCAKIQQQDFLKNIWCPIYEICIIEAAQSDTLLDCGECENVKVDFKENWEDLQHYTLLQYAYEPLRS